jgi:hypothetical protein
VTSCSFWARTDFFRKILPPYSRLKCTGSGIGLVLWANYTKGCHGTQGEDNRKEPGEREWEEMETNGDKTELIRGLLVYHYRLETGFVKYAHNSPFPTLDFFSSENWKSNGLFLAPTHEK